MQAIWSFEAGRLAAKDEGGNVVRSWTAEPSMGLFLAAFLNVNPNLSALLLWPWPGDLVTN